jgi:hypothetical protein
MGRSAILRVRMSLGRSPLLQTRRAPRDRLAPPHLCCLHIVGDDILNRPRLSRLRNCQRPGMGGKKRRCYTRQHQARQDGDGQYVLPNLLSPLWLGGPEHDALHAVVDSSACLEGNRVRGAREVVEIGLEQPEGLRHELVCTWAGQQETQCPDTHQQRAVDRLLAQVYYELLQGHGLVVDANEQVA